MRRSPPLPPAAVLLAFVVLLAGASLAACRTRPGTPFDGGGDRGPDGPPPPLAALKINEVVADDEGITIDETGQTADWVELYNAGTEPLDLSGFTLSDGRNRAQALSAQVLAPGAATMFWADEKPTQGPRHLGFKLSSAGERVVLGDRYGRVVDEITTPALGENEAMARFPDGSGGFVRCRYASPGRPNGQRCGPPPPPELPPGIEFPPFTWPGDPALPAPLAISEVALFPARFVEVVNHTAEPVDLSAFELRLAPLGPGDPLPGGAAGTALSWPQPSLGPGAWLAVPVPEPAEAPLGARAEREGVVTLFRVSDAAAGPTAVDFVDFMRWPDGAALVRDRGRTALLARAYRYCANPTPGAAPAGCQEIPSRAVGDRVRSIATPGDFAALAEGGSELESQSVKFVVDTAAGDTVHFLGTRRWALHYTFIREQIYKEAALDRCDPAQANLFLQGWIDFSLREYLQVQRRFMLGNLVRWGGSGLQTVDFAVGDVITGEQMRRTFFAVTSRLPDPQSWVVRPQAADQIERIRAVQGTLPIVDPDAPFRGQSFQPLVAATGYGTLRFVPGAELDRAPLGPDIIVVTDEVPNDIALVGGLITEVFQTPLAHVAILSKNRGTPNMALVRAHSDPRIAPLLDKLVRLDVTGAGFTVREAAPDEAAAFWEKLRPKGDPVSPRLDTSVRGIVDLGSRSLDDLPIVGAKAAQVGELYQLGRTGSTSCPAGLPFPGGAFAIPLVHSLEHFQASGAAALLESRRSDPAFVANRQVRDAALAEVRDAIVRHPADPVIVNALRTEIGVRFGTIRVRLRSSSNTEDLPGFTGAGLYSSLSVALGDPERDVETGLKTVWSSLWLPRAYDEREMARVDHFKTAMGVLVHAAYPNESANGVAISRNVLDPIYGDAFYFNAQAGEASVTNPAPGVVSEQGIYQLGRYPPVIYTTRSSLISGAVVTKVELDNLMCALGAIHRHFQSRIDPMHLNRWFAMDIEWKLVGPARQLVIKQARPYSFGRTEVPVDCREF
jgi:hypothetical protein